MGSITYDYRGTVIPDTALFNITWWLYFAVVVLTTLLTAMLLLSLLCALVAGSGSMSKYAGTAVIVVTCAVVLFAPFIVLQWFALMWKDWACLIAALALAVMLMLSQITGMICGRQQMQQQNRAGLCSFFMSPVLSVILLSIMIVEIHKIKAT